MIEYKVLSIPETLLIALAGFLIVFAMLLALIVIIKIISAVVVKVEGAATSGAPAAPAPAPAAAPAKAEEEKPSKPWDGKLQLIDCDEETAACIMAIISDETDIPLDELQFRRIAAL